MKDTNPQADLQSEEDPRRSPKGDLPLFPLDEPAPEPIILYPDGEPELDEETQIIRDELEADADIDEVEFALSGVLGEITQHENMSESLARKHGTEKIVQAFEDRLDILRERAEVLRDLRRKLLADLERKNR